MNGPLPIALLLLLSAILLGLVPLVWRRGLVVLVPLIMLWLITEVPDGVVTTAYFLGKTIQPVEGSDARRLVAALLVVVLWGASLYALQRARWFELAAGQAYAAGAVGVCFAGDLVSLFLYWEVMAIFSAVLVWSGGTRAARDAGIRYGLVHILGGIILKVGIEGVMVHTGSIEIRVLTAADFNTWMLILGVLVNVAAFPLVAWLPDANTHASGTGSVYLSAFTTKTGLLALLLIFPGDPLLLPLGLITAAWATLYALLEITVRKALAYALVAQLGLMTGAIGIGTEAGTLTLLLMLGGHVLGFAFLFAWLDCQGGAAGRLTIRNLALLVGALLVSFMPLASGMLDLFYHQGRVVFVVALLVSLIGVVAVPLRLWWAEEGRGLSRPTPALYLLLLLALGASLAGPWVLPAESRGVLPPWELKPALAFLLPALVLLLAQRWLARLSGIRRQTTDIDYLWRRTLPRLYRGALGGWERIARPLVSKRRQFGARWNEALFVLLGSRGPLGRSWEIGTTALWVVAILSAYVALYYLL